MSESLDLLEQGLVPRLLAGDEDAFEKFFAQVFPGLFRYALSRMKRDADGAEEVVQSALCKAVGKLHTFRGDSALFTWLCTFCRHEISAFYRSRGKIYTTLELSEELPEVRSALVDLSESADDSPDRQLHENEMRGEVHATLDELPARYADVLEWKYSEELTVVEIARRLGSSEKAAESLLTRARAAFRDRFESRARRGAEPALRTVKRPRKKWNHG